MLKKSLTAKILTGFFVVVFISLVASGITIYDLMQNIQEMKIIEAQRMPLIGKSADNAFNAANRGIVFRDYLMTGDENALQAFEKLESRNRQLEKELHDAALTEVGRQMIQQVEELDNSYTETAKKVINLKKAGKDQEAVQVNLVEAAPQNKALINQLEKYQEFRTQQMNADFKSMVDEQSKIMWLVIIFGVAALGAGAVIAVFTARAIAKPVKALTEAADKLAVGDVNVNVEVTTQDEIGFLMQSFDKMVDSIREQAVIIEKVAEGDLTVQVKVRSENDLLGKKLGEMIKRNNQILGDINFAAEQVAAGSQQIAASGEALSQGSTEQASSIEEITASMTQVAAQTKLNAVNANQANELSTAVEGKAVEGKSQMQDMVKAMAEINESSANISKIIKVIDEIAFQTNILALNAAVEAARAGQHGKGFAVVAEEVRNLAARSADAAKETTAMIEGSIKKVDSGTKIANETSEALNGIVDGVAQVAILVGDIAGASNEQATAISQVNQAIAQVSQVVQTNSATAEESASSSEELSSQAEVLKNNVSKFKLKQMNKFQGGENLSPEVLRTIEMMLDKKQQESKSEERSAKHEPMLTARTKIVLDDNEFDKY
ncbi:methyl-accepting chemotaxis protein [Sporomusaceae bacterium BoRhaA]|uniref:methyl-accepting chemotaxis protein n=1 Tax=Pelorhabdus rhamnosifermentans TaxID=2772457 RepID=UPI001C061ECC|nr:methyl-accepting chemotaxis protein [Pelorhabdus rhamnosifermentans]MBU2699976.1 methyl-accepting chemotaxis protein [Pelorhabdus rhamnosifermentans]